MPDEFNGTDVMEDGLGSGTQSVGAGLREVRERLGWKLPDVAETLRIRPEFLEAIEAGNLAALPGPAYRAGFVRSYSRALGLDADEILRRFRAEGGLPDTAKTETRFITTVPDSGVPKGAAVAVGILLLLAGYALWFHYSGTQRHLAEEVPAVPAQLAPLAIPPKIEVAPVIPAPAPPAPVAAPVASGTVVAPGATMPATPPPATAGTEGPPPPAVPGAIPLPTIPGAPASDAGLVISATQDAWIEVHDPAGNILFSKVLHPGESWPVPQESGLTLTTGNAGGTVITNNGVASAPLGAPSAVLHNYQLTSGTAAPVAATTPAPVTPPAPAPSAPAPAKPSTTPAPHPSTSSSTTSAAGNGKKSQAAPSGTP
jgi:cytoskeleton protein RodZ